MAVELSHEERREVLLEETMELREPGTPRKLNLRTPDRLKRVIGDEKNENLLGAAARDACHMRSWRLMFLLVVGME